MIPASAIIPATAGFIDCYESPVRPDRWNVVELFSVAVTPEGTPPGTITAQPRSPSIAPPNVSRYPPDSAVTDRRFASAPRGPDIRELDQSHRGFASSRISLRISSQ